MLIHYRVAMLGLSLIVFVANESPASEYNVAGFTLGERLAPHSDRLQRVDCRQSENFLGLQACTRVETIQERGRSQKRATSLLTNSEGRVLYIETQIGPQPLTKAQIEQQLGEFSKTFAAKPTMLEWSDIRGGEPPSVLAAWGSVHWEDVRQDVDDLISSGNKNPQLGVLVDRFGDIERSVKQFKPIYRIAGGIGYFYSANIDNNGVGYTRQISVDGGPLVLSHFQSALQSILRKDQTLSESDISLWPDVARLTRQLARDTTQKKANAALEEAFAASPSRKLFTRVWSILPGGTIDRIALHQYGTVDVYPAGTKYVEIRRDIEEFLATKPTDPFIELLYYVIGDFEGALRVAPRSPFKDLFRYAIGYEIMRTLLSDIEARLKQDKPDLDISLTDDVSYGIRYLNENSELYGGKPLKLIVPTFSALASKARPYFEDVLEQATTAHADDAAYMLGWLAFHEGNKQDALKYFSKAMSVGNGDYKYPGATRRVVEILNSLPSADQIKIVEADHAFEKQPALAYVAARSIYREFKYEAAIQLAAKFLKQLGVGPDFLPATTDPKRVSASLRKLAGDEADDPNLVELPYLLQASKEFIDYEAFLKANRNNTPDQVLTRARSIVLKYSTLVDNLGDDSGIKTRPPILAHRDFRQALHLIDVTLDNLPASARYAKLREWLYYRKVRVSTRFAPDEIPKIIAAMRTEFPRSRLLDDVLAEQLFAQGLILRDLPSARATFNELINEYPNGNAIDNAYSWMAIILRCEGKLDEAQALNREIIQRFPFTRHATYARKRLASPNDRCGYPGFDR
jgi:tetratricopeptide (TPR) repeat protein